MRSRRFSYLPLVASACIVLAGCGSQAAPGASASAAVAPPVPGVGDGLAAYVGKYPDEEIGGVSWAMNKAVSDGVRQVVSDPRVAARVLAYAGPTTPIAQVDGKIVAGQCDPANCSGLNWEVLVDPMTGQTQVCYHDAKRTPGKSIWFLAAGKEEQRAGPCAIG